MITATSCTDELEQADDDRRQIEAALVSGRASSEPVPRRELLPGIRPRARLVNVLIMQPSGTSSAAGAAPSVTGALHAQLTSGPREVDEL